MLFSEEFLHYVWQHRLFTQNNLIDCEGNSINIINTGILNANAGPDFNNAKVIINKTTWAGNVEIHIKSSDWQRHKHHLDEAYDSVILHVVWEHDLNVFRTNCTLIPTLVLKNLVNTQLISQYQYLKTNQNWIPCEHQLPLVNPFIINQWLQRVLIERFEQKSNDILLLNQQLKGNWEETFYIILAQNFGFKVNALPFNMLAQSLPQQIIAKHKNNTTQIEAIIFGQAGFLKGSFNDDYPNLLKSEYAFLQKKYGLKPLDKALWKFSKLRPNNFPTVRLAQFAAIVCNSTHLFSKILETTTIKSLKALFNSAKINQYWHTHFHFDITTSPSFKTMGSKSLDLIIINTIAVITFCYGKQIANDIYVNNAVNLIECVKPEKNNIVENFKRLGINALNAYDSQALIHLKNNYCEQKKCLHCGIGNKILNS